MSMSGSSLTFDPKRLSLLATDLDLQQKRLTEALANIRARGSTLKANWQGEASELYASRLRELDAKGEELKKTLHVLCQDLANVSGVYAAGEGQAKRKVEGLPTEGVFRI